MVVQDANFVRGWMYAQKDLPKPLMEAINSVCDFVHDYSEAQLTELTMKNYPPMVTGDITAAIMNKIHKQEEAQLCTECRQPIIGYGGDVKAHPGCSANASLVNPSYKPTVTDEQKEIINRCVSLDPSALKMINMSAVEAEYGSPVSAAELIKSEQIAKDWTPERRAAQGRIMRENWKKRNAAKAAARVNDAVLGSIKAELPKTFTDHGKPGADHTAEVTAKGNKVLDIKITPATKPTIRRVDTYIGKREDGILQESDFGDIRDRVAKGDSWALIAGDYDCPVAVLLEWYEKMAVTVDA